MTLLASAVEIGNNCLMFRKSNACHVRTHNFTHSRTQWHTHTHTHTHTHRETRVYRRWNMNQIKIIDFCTHWTKYHRDIPPPQYCSFLLAVSFHQSGFSDLEVACWPLVPKFAGSNPADAVGIFRAKKIPSTPSFGREVKPFVPRRIFTACKRFTECYVEVGHFQAKIKSAISRSSSSSIHY